MFYFLISYESLSWTALHYIPNVSDPLHLFISVSSETGVIGGCDPPLWVLGIKLGPLEEQPVLLTAESSLQPPPHLS